MKKFLTGLLIFIVPSILSAQLLYQGPSTGTVPHGVIVTTNNFMSIVSGKELPQYLRRPLRNKYPFHPYPDKLNTVPPMAPEGANYFIDPIIKANKFDYNIDPFVIKGFLESFDPGNYIPPDFYVAAGPSHIIGVDNGRFRIWDKNGNMIKSINPDSWFGSTIPGPSAFDPKVLYDQFAKRWIMVWLDEIDLSHRGTILISVSQDSIPLGTWYNYGFPATMNGTNPTDSWGDYQGVGFDDQALYITTNQFQFAGNFEGAKIRIIKKSELYANNAGPVSFTDLWDVREPTNTGIQMYGIRPVIFYSPYTSGYYLVSKPPFYPSNTSMDVFKITNPVTNPVMTAMAVPTTAYLTPPSPNQLGGSDPPIEAGGCDLRDEPVYRYGYIWGVHQIRSGTNGLYSAIRYFKINTLTNITEEDGAMGADGYWHYYISLCVDKDTNVAITYTRSGDNEYAGAFYTSRLNSDPPNYLSGSKLLQAGKSNYNKTFGSGRNRWGDYNGVWLDPSDQNNFWMLTEYAETPLNTWAGWMSNVRLIPFSGAKLLSTKDSLNFGVVEAGFISDTSTFSISNYGNDTLIVNKIDIMNSQFRISNPPSFPIKLGFNQSRVIKFNYFPNIRGIIFDSLIISSNDITNPNKKVILQGKGYIINPVRSDSIYAITGSQSNGSFLSINKISGNASLLGLSGYSEITGLSIRPSNKNIFGCIPLPNTKLIRINSQEGDGYFAKNISLAYIRSIAFDTNDVLYCSTLSGDLYKYNIITDDTLLIKNTGILNLYGITINPMNGQMWGISLNNKIYKIDKTTGNSVQVGVPGINLTQSIAFDSKGSLYGLAGFGSLVTNFLKYDTATGTATIIGSTNYKALNSFVIAPFSQSPLLPVSYNLYQNYPNPFNAGTTFEFDIPNTTNIDLTIYDVLGRKIITLASGQYSAGNYKIKFSEPNLPSGLYLYRLKTEGFTSVKKFVIVK